MRTLGLVGGTGWISTLEYYRLINRGINEALGGHEFARCILYSINFGDIIACNERGDAEGVYALVMDAAERVIRGGAEGIVLCANTLHKFAGRMQREIEEPIIHITDATARAIKGRSLSTVGLLGTRYTMEEDFYVSRLRAAGILTIVPEEDDREFINTTIYEELLKEIFKEESRKRLLEIMAKLERRGAEGIILGCTEIPLIIHDDDFGLPLFDTTVIHARAAVDFALGT